MEGATAPPLSPRLRVRSRVASATRFAGRHRVLLALAVVVVLGGGIAAGAILASRSSYAATRPIGAALVKSPVVGSGALPYHHHRVLVQIGVPTIVNFVPGATFAIAVIVTNKAGAPVTLERARAALPSRSPLRQIGARLIAFKPFVCPPGASCPFIDPIGEPPYGAEQPVPLTVGPGHEALVRLDFRFASCRSKSLHTSATVRKVTLLYRSPDGAAIHQRLRLGDSVPQITGAPVQPTCRS
jgi:hypothetical protein